MIKLYLNEKATNEHYISKDKEFVIRRENGKTPNGNLLNNKWVLRNKDGKFIDFDQYRNDLAERNNMKLEH
jgi:hypothetical protein